MNPRKKKKILIFTPGAVGGAERMSVLLGKLLPRDRFEVKYVVVGRLKDIYEIMPEGYEVDCLPLRNIYAFSVPRIWWKIRRERPDVVFTSQASYNPRVILAARLARRKIIVRSTGMMGTYDTKTKLFVRPTYPLADLLIAQHEDMRQEMIRMLRVPAEKVATIHNPLDRAEIDRLAGAPSPFAQDGAVNFVQSASVCHRKAQDVALEAFALVRERIPSAQLYFVGRYDEADAYCRSLQATIPSRNLQACVHFVGHDPNPFRWVKHASCFLLPSRAEGLPNALIEASYLGVPCVASRCLRIVSDIVRDGENGYTFPVDDAQAMAQAMLRAVELRDCRMTYHPGTADEWARIVERVGEA